MSDKKNLLPPGWDCKYDEKSGRCYYINYLTRAMQLQDPRIGYKQLENDSVESIPLQPMHGSPYHVYPVNSFAAVRAFQGPHSSIQSISGSPLMSTASQMTMETPLLRTQESPYIPRFDSSGSNRRKSIPMQETSFTNQIDTNAVVSKIQTMFPTAGENHIRLLLKKYYNREAVVISALQVEKHPLCTPGPFTTPPIQRHLFNQSNSAFQMTPPTRRFDYYSRSGSPMPNSSNFRPSSIKNGFAGHLYGSPKVGEQIRNSPKPHSSPKMKLRYMKNIFPKADETLLLDVLANSDNNVQKASEKLSTMGYSKRDVQAMANQAKIDAERMMARKDKLNAAEKIIPLHPKEFTDIEKDNIKAHLQEKYPKITERIVSMALESVGYSEERAIQILQIVQQEDDDRAKKETYSKDIKTMESEIDIGNTTIKESFKEPIVIGTDQLDYIEKNSNENSNKIYRNSIKDATQLQHNKSHAKFSSPKSSTHINNNSNNTEPQNITIENVLINNINNNNNNNNSTKELHKSNSKNDTININYEEKTEVDNKSSNEMNNCVTGKQDPQQQNQNQNEMSTSSSSSSAVSSSFLSSMNAKGSKCILKYRTRNKSGSLKNSSSSSNDIEKDAVYQQEFQSILGRITTMGHNKELTSGPNENLLLADYVTWSGANPNLTIMSRTKTKGPDANNLKNDRVTAHGSNSELCKGPQLGLAKGSIYTNLNANIKCN